MLRPLTTLFAAAACLAASVAQACLCALPQTQAEADAAGARAYAAADLIVDATVGDVSWLHRTVCRGSVLPTRLIGFGQAISADRPIAVHRVLKGHAGPVPILIGKDTRVETVGCVTRDSSCDLTIRSQQRRILFLHREADGRYRPLSGCEELALRNSRAGQALFKRAG